MEQVVALYRNVVGEFSEISVRDLDAESRAEAFYLRQLSGQYEQQRDSFLNSRTFRLRQRLLKIPFAGVFGRFLARRF